MEKKCANPDCKVESDKVKFSGRGKVCNLCTHQKKLLKNAHKTPASVPVPQKCANPECETPVNNLEFNWNQTHWRNKCKACEKHAKEASAKSKSLPSKFKCTGQCGKVKLIDAFEKTGNGGFRQMCKVCRSNARKESVKSLSTQASRSTPPPDAKLPEECSNCHGKPPEKEFVWRYHDVITPSYRTMCTECHDKIHKVYSHNSRDKKKNEDLDKYVEDQKQAYQDYVKKTDYPVHSSTQSGRTINCI